jgi:hypothetical protein
MRPHPPKRTTLPASSASPSPLWPSRCLPFFLPLSPASSAYLTLWTFCFCFLGWGEGVGGCGRACGREVGCVGGVVGGGGGRGDGGWTERGQKNGRAWSPGTARCATIPLFSLLSSPLTRAHTQTQKTHLARLVRLALHVLGLVHLAGLAITAGAGQAAALVLATKGDGRGRNIPGRGRVRRGRGLRDLDDLLGLDDLLDGDGLGDDGLRDLDGPRADADPHRLVALHRLHDLDGLVARDGLDDLHGGALAPAQQGAGVDGRGGRGQDGGGDGGDLVHHF